MDYSKTITDIVTKFGGEYLVNQDGEYQCFEGEWKFPRIKIVIKFLYLVCINNAIFNGIILKSTNISVRQIR